MSSITPPPPLPRLAHQLLTSYIADSLAISRPVFEHISIPASDLSSSSRRLARRLARHVSSFSFDGMFLGEIGALHINIAKPFVQNRFQELELWSGLLWDCVFVVAHITWDQRIKEFALRKGRGGG